MAIYLVGDIQGCHDELINLLKHVSFDDKADTLYIAGDLVARGPDSLKTLRFVKSLGSSAKVVLGNHDLHLLAVYAGIKKVKTADKLAALLCAHDVDELMNWLAAQPLIQSIPNRTIISDIVTQEAADDNPAYMTHAGISPQWTLDDAITQAAFVQSKLASDERNTWLSRMYGEKPNNWTQAKTEIEKFRYSINALTRMRYCFMDGSLEFEQKHAPSVNNSNNLRPWYELSSTINNTTWVFGHWASLMGKSSHDNIYPLDTGCVWGNHLTMLRWHDKKYFSQAAIPKKI
ncbi:MAG: symmetrical bis(5'-nucleosyl)-tetraphosphatase [Colwellia sp.]|nr:symmetrical bis(5'-nucleosyl)-tetraphosphatase [Colwellia sp.]